MTDRVSSLLDAVENSAPDFVVRLAGVEPATLGLEVRCSIQLSYRRTPTYDTPTTATWTQLGLSRLQRARVKTPPPSTSGHHVAPRLDNLEEVLHECLR